MRLFELFQSKPVLRLLEFFLEHSSKEFYAAQLSGVKNLGVSRAALFQSLARLEEAEILVSRRVGRNKLYKLNATPLVKQAKVLLSLSVFWPALKKFSGKNVEIYLYGSAARGENNEESDVDLLVVGNRDAQLEREIVLSVKRAKTTCLTRMEYAALSRKDKAFYESIERDKIRLV